MPGMLEVKEVSRRFGSVLAVNSSSFTVEQGTVTALIGPNGSGKTTLFNLITGYLAPNHGRVLFRGRDVTGMDAGMLYRRGLTRTFQQARVFPQLSVRENLAVASGFSWRQLFTRRLTKSDLNRVDSLLEDFGLAHVANLYASELSYGQRKLVEFAAVLMSEPAMVLLDEPTAGVNPTTVSIMQRHIRKRHERGVTFLVVEHDMEFVMRTCDPVIVLDRGRPIFAGTPAEVQTNPLVLDAYLGS
jgi:ABC-type branched-subunit amino acid transport system ATPase component